MLLCMHSVGVSAHGTARPTISPKQLILGCACRGTALTCDTGDTEQLLVWGIIAANTAVWLLGSVPALALALPPLHLRAHTMLTSNFSHSSLMHLTFNMTALSSFGPSVAAVMGPFQFAAFYVSAGLASSAASVIGR